jgi:hypothetical protein
MRDAAKAAAAKWETWVVVAYNVLAALMAQGLIPEGRWHQAGTIASVVLTNVLALLGRQVLAPRDKTRAGDLAETVADMPPPVPVVAKRPRKAKP